MSDSSMAHPSVVILGAGIGGLTLGRCLRQRGIHSVIYEKAPSAPRHSYGITLQPWACKPLLNVLDIDETTFRKRLAIDNLNPPGIGASTPFRINRSKLESMLQEGQDIRFENALSSATIPADGGSVELSFQNGIKLRPAHVVDALGVHSPLRKSLLPDIKLDVQPFAVYSGKRYINRDLFTSTYAPSFRNNNILTHHPSAPNYPRLEITINDRLPNNTISIRYIYSRPAIINNNNNNQSTTDPLHHPARPIAGATAIPEALYSELHSLLSPPHPIPEPFQTCFSPAQIRTERVLHWLMRTIMVPEQDLLRLLSHGVIMIGDAVHAVPILGAHGANMAILDAIELAEAFVKSREDEGKKEGKWMLEAFYERRWQWWCDEVEEGKKMLVEMHGGGSTFLLRG